MKRELTRIDPISATLFTATITLALSIALFLLIPLLNVIGLAFDAEVDLGAATGWMFLIIPLTSVITNSIFVFIGCHVYNLIAYLVGGIRYYTNDVPDSPATDDSTQNKD